MLKKFFISGLFIVLISLTAFAKISEHKIEGIVVAFDKLSVTIKNEFGQNTKVPKSLVIEGIKTGEAIRLILTEKQYEEILRINTK